jgi:peptidoglycan/LPS O-acetylase OafA/YrhL
MNTLENRIAGLDGLRAFSILIVLVSHISFSHSNPDKFYLTGNLGVRIFFAISGFLITNVLIKEFEKEAKINLKRFYFRRVFRIFPAYLFFMGFMMLFTVFGIFSLTNFLPPLTYTTNYLFPTVSTELRHTWSLAVEEQFYLIFPIVFSFVGLANFRKFLIIILFVTPVFRMIAQLTPSINEEQQFLSTAWNFHTNMDILASGCLLALYRNELHLNKYYRKFLGASFSLVFLILLILLLGYFSEKYLMSFYAFGITIMNLSIVLCIDWLIVNKQSQISKLLNLTPLRFIGVLSYSIYLWQQLFTCYSEMMPWTYFPCNLILISK